MNQKLVPDLYFHISLNYRYISTKKWNSYTVDKATHNILLTKLEHYGIKGHANYWPCSFLTDSKKYMCKRKQFYFPRNYPWNSLKGSVLVPCYSLYPSKI